VGGASTAKIVIVPDTSKDTRSSAVDEKTKMETRSDRGDAGEFRDTALGVIELINCVGRRV